MFIRALVTAVVYAGLALSQCVTPPTDLTTKLGYAGQQVRFKEVPTGICELDPKVKSYSGYVDVGENEHLFFWFFETRTGDPEKAPLSVWINGGPGSTSMFGLWQELGPCGVNHKGEVYSNPYSWTNASNMIFIDEPVTVGFSYSVPIHGLYNETTGEVTPLTKATCPQNTDEDCGTWSAPQEKYTANSTDNAAPNFWKALQGFMGVFPQYSRESFSFTTESYGGHYAPVFNEYFETQNAKNIPGAHKINLKTVTIGNGWYDPLIQYQAYYNYTVSPGNPYHFKPFNASFEKLMFDNLYGKGNCTDGIRHCAATGDNDICSKADDFCANNVEELLDDPSINRDEYDIRELQPDPFPYGYFEDYLNTEKVQKAIGAFVNFSDFSGTTADAFGKTGDDGREVMSIEDVGKLLEQNVTVLMYAGDADYNCNYLGGQVVASLVDAPGFDKAGYENLSTPDAVVHGQVKQADTFSFARIYYSGHEVPFYQPVAALALFERAINSKDIATGKVNVKRGGGYKSKGPAETTFQEGPATVQHHVLSVNATYNETTFAPNPIPGVGGKGATIFPPVVGRAELQGRPVSSKTKSKAKAKAKAKRSMLLG